MKTIVCINADVFGNKLYLKDLIEDKGKLYVKYRSTYNDIPFQETEIFGADNGRNCIITADNGTVLWRFSVDWLDKLRS